MLLLLFRVPPYLLATYIPKQIFFLSFFLFLFLFLFFYRAQHQSQNHFNHFVVLLTVASPGSSSPLLCTISIATLTVFNHPCCILDIITSLISTSSTLSNVNLNNSCFYHQNHSCCTVNIDIFLIKPFTTSAYSLSTLYDYPLHLHISFYSQNGRLWSSHGYRLPII